MDTRAQSTILFCPSEIIILGAVTRNGNHADYDCNNLLGRSRMYMYYTGLLADFHVQRHHSVPDQVGFVNVRSVSNDGLTLSVALRVRSRAFARDSTLRGVRKLSRGPSGTVAPRSASQSSMSVTKASSSGSGESHGMACATVRKTAAVNVEWKYCSRVRSRPSMTSSTDALSRTPMKPWLKYLETTVKASSA